MQQVSKTLQGQGSIPWGCAKTSILNIFIYLESKNIIMAYKDKNDPRAKKSRRDWYYKNKKRQSGSLDAAQALEADAFFDGDEAQMMLQKALGELPDKQRLVFNMKYYDDMTYQQMSEILDTSVGALKASFHHAVKKIEFYFKKVQI